MGLESPTLEKTPGDTENLIVEQEEKVVEAQNEVNKQQPADIDGEPEANQDKDNPGKGLGGEHKTLPFFLLYHHIAICWGISSVALFLSVSA